MGFWTIVIGVAMLVSLAGIGLSLYLRRRGAPAGAPPAPASPGRVRSALASAGANLALIIGVGAVVLAVMALVFGIRAQSTASSFGVAIASKADTTVVKGLNAKVEAVVQLFNSKADQTAVDAEIKKLNERMGKVETSQTAISSNIKTISTATSKTKNTADQALTKASAAQDSLAALKFRLEGIALAGLAPSPPSNDSPMDTTAVDTTVAKAPAPKNPFEELKNQVAANAADIKDRPTRTEMSEAISALNKQLDEHAKLNRKHAHTGK